MKNHLHKFSKTYLSLYQNKYTKDEQIIDGFCEKCIDLNFKIDDGKALMAAFQKIQPFENPNNLKTIINQVNDSQLLGSAIFSMWSQITNGKKSGELLSDKNRLWFIMAFTRLKELTEEKSAENSKIILFPEFVALKTEVEKLRTEISMLLLEQDELLLVECKNIEMAYMLALGHLEYKVYELQCVILRLKRKSELIQAKKNRQEKIVLTIIEQILDSEFAQYQAQLDEQINKMNAALKRNQGDFLSEADTKELKKRYRSIMKVLHPDLRPDITEAEIALFHRAVSAYENGDLNSLRIIDSMVANPVSTDHKENNLTTLLKEKERLTNLLQVVKEQIATIKNEYPYTMKSLVQDDEQIAEKKMELEEMISQLKETLKLYQARIEKMLR